MRDKMGENQELTPLELEKKTFERLESDDINKKVKESRKGGRNYYAVYPPQPIKDNFNWDELYKILLYDIWSRFKSMRTFNVRHGLGFDPYNLRVERSVLKDHDSKSLAGISGDEWGDIFSEMDERADELKEDMTEQVESLGFWKDLEAEYDTRDEDFVDSLWWSVSEVMDKDFLTKYKKPLVWCPECKSPVTNTETFHKEQTKEKALVKVPASGGKERYFLTEVEEPWTLPGSLSLVVRPEEVYSVVRYTTEDGGTAQVVVIQDKVEEVMERGEVEDYEVINEVKGKKLEGIGFKYPLFDKVPYHTELEGEFVHEIFCSEDVSKEGTGLVFFAPPYREEHWQIAKENGLTAFNPIEKNGYYNSGVRNNKYSGLSALQSNQMILDDIDTKDLLFSREKEDRKVKFCDACLNKVIKIPHREWFFKITDDSDDERLQNFIDEMGLIPSKEEIDIRDWIVTKGDRWGISFPLWECKCGASFTPEDRSELSENSNYREEEPVTPDIISKVDVRCPECGKEMEWEEKTLNSTFIKASSPWAQLGYPHDEIEYQSWWPGKIFISKSAKRDDLLSATLSLSFSLLEDTSIENMLLQGSVVSEIDYKDVRSLASNQGYDSLRLHLLSDKPPWETRKIKGEDLQEPHPLVRVLWNLNTFLESRLEKHETEPGDTTLEFLRENMDYEDEWLLSKIEDTKREVREAYEKARYDLVIEKLEGLVLEDVAQWYYSRAKSRLEEEKDEDVVLSILKVLHESLISVSKMIVPLSPFLAEEVYNRLDGKLDSAFLNDWPESNELLRNGQLEEEMKEVKNIVDHIIKTKRKNGIPEKWPLKRIIYDGKNSAAMDVIEKFEQLIKDKAKVKKIEIIDLDEEWDEKLLDVYANEEAIGRAYSQWKSRIATMLNQKPPKKIKNGIEEGEFEIGLEGQLIEIRPEMVTFETSLPDGFEEIELRNKDIYVDMNIYDEIWEEVIARETILRLKRMREDFDLEDEDEIEADVKTTSEMADALEEYRGMILEEANVRELSINEEEGTEERDYVYEWDINGETVEIGVEPLYKNKVVNYYQNLSGVDEEIAENLYEGGFTSVEDLQAASASEISDIKGVKRSLARGMIQSLQEIEEKGELPEEEREEIDKERKEVEPGIEEKEEKEEEKEVKEKEIEMKEEERVEEVAEKQEKRELPEGIERSSSYIVTDKESDKPKSFGLFKEILKTEKEGLCVTRDYPNKVKDRYGLENVEMIWLSNVDREDVIRPKSLEKFSLTVENFLTRSKGVILLNGLEYLITNNDFRTVLHLIQSLKDQVAINESIMMIPINPDTLEENQMDLLSGEVDKVINP